MCVIYCNLFWGIFLAISEGEILPFIVESHKAASSAARLWFNGEFLCEFLRIHLQVDPPRAEPQLKSKWFLCRSVIQVYDILWLG